MTPTDSNLDHAVLVVRNTAESGPGELLVFRRAPGGSDAAVRTLPYENLVQGYRDLAPVLHEEYENGVRGLVVDMRNVPWIDSTGIGTLVGLTRKFRDGGGQIALANPRPRVAGVFRLTGLEALFRLFNGEEEAVQWLREGGD